MLDENDLKQIEEIVLRVVSRSSGDPFPILPRLTIRQFAVAVEMNEEVIARKIRVGAIPDEYVFGLRPKKISPKALELFGVTTAEAKARLVARNLLP